MTPAYKECAVPNDAIANLAKPRETDEEPFLEERWNGVIEISRLGKIPQSFDDFRRIRCRRKEIRHQPEPVGDLTLEVGSIGR